MSPPNDCESPPGLPAVHKPDPRLVSEVDWQAPAPRHDGWVTPGGLTTRVRAINGFLRSLLFNIKMGLGLLLFVPTDAGLLASYGPFHSGGYSFLFWFALILYLTVEAWRQAPRLRRQTWQLQSAAGAPAPEPEPIDTSDLLGAIVSVLGGIFLVLIAGTDAKHSVGARWEWGFRIGGALLCGGGVWTYYRMAFPKR